MKVSVQFFLDVPDVGTDVSIDDVKEWVEWEVNAVTSLDGSNPLRGEDFEPAWNSVTVRTLDEDIKLGGKI